MIFKFFRNKKEIPQIQQKELIKEAKERNVLNNENFKPIRACLVDSADIDSLTQKTISEIEKNGQFINWDGDESFFRENNLRNSGERTYVISESNEKDKYSTRYCNCTGIIAVGEENNSSKQTSFLSHQDPWKFLSDNKSEFTTDLIQAIRELKSKTKDNSIDVVVFGGHTENRNEYEKSIKYISDILTKEFGFQPTIVTGPNQKVLQDPTRVYFDSQNRRLYLLRPDQKSEVNENYLSGELEDKKKAWRRGY